MGALAAFLKPFIGLAAVVAAVYLHQTYTVRTIPDDLTQMEPAVRPRQMVLWRTPEGAPPRGTVVWLEHPSFPEKMLVSRVIAGPGDRVAILKGKVYLNGQPLAEDYASKKIDNEVVEDLVVPADHVYILNDARGGDGRPTPASDSRRLGPIPAGLIVGVSGDGAEGGEGRGAGAKKARP